jgi:hypothetical protein
MISLGLVIGYHGCERQVAEKVVVGSVELIPSQNAWDWLGHGTYYWEDSPDRALRWARDHTDQPAVIAAAISLGNCLNLADLEAVAMLKAAHEAYLAICEASGTEPARNKGRDLRARFLDCAVLETLHRLREQEGLPPFDTVRGFFIEGREVYPDAGFRELDHVQVCVRSPKQILGHFWPRKS